MTVTDREEMKADEIFSLYLFRVSRRVNQKYYTDVVLPFLILFRECYDGCGWQKKFGD